MKNKVSQKLDLDLSLHLAIINESQLFCSETMATNLFSNYYYYFFFFAKKLAPLQDEKIMTKSLIDSRVNLFCALRTFLIAVINITVLVSWRVCHRPLPGQAPSFARIFLTLDHAFLSPGTNRWIRNLDLETVWQELCHCAIPAGNLTRKFQATNFDQKLNTLAYYCHL